MKTLNNNIQESYCSFEVSRLLKGKGCTLGENRDGLITHALTVEWLRVNFGILILVYPQRYEVLELMWSYSISNIEDGYVVDGLEFPEISNPNEIPVWTSPQEATEAALKYVLEELI